MQRHVVLIALGLLALNAGGVGTGTVSGASAPAAAQTTARTSATAACAATRVHYERSRDAGSGLSELPWITAGRGANRLVGYLFYYGSSVLGDSRFNRSPGVVIPVGGVIPAGNISPSAATKILWFTRGKASRRLLILGRRLDAPGTFRHTEDAALSPSGNFPSIIELPSAGCWRLTLKTGRVTATVVVQAVDLPERPVCEPTPVRRDPNARLGAPRWMELTPSSAGLYAIGSVSTDADATEASIYPGSFYPGGKGTKIMWVPTRTERIGTVLVIRGKRLDGPANDPSVSFRQEHRVAYGQTPPLVGPVFPSIVNVPSAGCWLLTLRAGQTAGIAVFRALEPGG